MTSWSLVTIKSRGYKMDEKDREILEELMQDGKAKISQIARKLALPMSTVHHRILKMEREKIIKSYSALPDYRKIGLSVSAYIFINVEYAGKFSQEAVAREIRKLPNVLEVNIVSGDIDMIAKIRGKDVESLSSEVIERVRNIKGVAKTTTSFVMREIE